MGSFLSSGEWNNAGEGSSPIGDLPDECFVRILDELPTRELFVVKRISRKWAAASQFVIERRHTLRLGQCFSHNWSDPHRHAQCTIDLYFDEERMMQSLLKLKLRELCIGTVSARNAERLILANAGHLRDLCVSSKPPIPKTGFPELIGLRCRHFGHYMVKACPKLRTLFVDTEGTRELLLMNDVDPGWSLATAVMPQLDRLVVTGSYYMELVSNNASTIRVLSTSGSLPYIRFISPTYERLEEFNGSDFSCDDAKSCPGLKRLTVRRLFDIDALNFLPDDMTIVDITMAVWHCKEDTRIERAVKAIARFSHLRKLHLTQDKSDPAPANPIVVAHLFNKMHDLVDVCINLNWHYSPKRVAGGREMVQRLVANNKGLRSLSLSHIVRPNDLRNIIPENVSLQMDPGFNPRSD